MKEKASTQLISDLVLGKLSPEESLKLLEKIEQDPEASQELETATETLRFARTHGKELFEPGRDLVERAAPARWYLRERLQAYLSATRVTRWVAALALFCVLILTLVVASSLSTDKYYPLAAIEGLEIESTVRGAGQEDLSAANVLYVRGDLDGALRLLERYIRAFPHDEMIDYVHYSAGAIYLLSARKSFLSLFPSYDYRRVVHGLDLLETAANISTNKRLVEASRWLRAKGFLMLHRPTDAVNELERVQALGGGRSAQASLLIAKIQEVESKE